MESEAHFNPRVLMLIPSDPLRYSEEDVKCDRFPLMDTAALQVELGADVLYYDTGKSNDGRLAQFLQKWLSKDIHLAWRGFKNRKHYDVIYSNGENVSIPLAMLFKLCRRRPRHVLIAHRLSPKKKRPFFRTLKVHRQMDVLFMYSTLQIEFAKRELGIADEKLRWIPFQVDADFFRPLPIQPRRMICSAGLEWRDYPTLIRAVDGLDVEVCLAAASPWSKHRDETENRPLPPNVSARRYDYNELRQLYNQSVFVVVPLYENDFQAGITTMLEAMAAGKAVMVTKTSGQRDMLVEGEHGRYIPVGDSEAWRAAIQEWLANPEVVRRMGENGRELVEKEVTVRLWAYRIAEEIRKVASGPNPAGRLKPIQADRSTVV